MKFNISYPVTGQQKKLEIEDDKIVRQFFDRKIGHEVNGEILGQEFAGYIFRISGGNDKQGFPMKQGILTSQRVRLLLKKGMSCYRPRRTGERKRKSVRGCIVGPEIGILNLVVVQKGEQEIEGITDEPRPRRLGPKRAANIRKMFALDQGVQKGAKIEDRDDVRRYVVRRKIEKEDGKVNWKAPKIQRLITAERIRRKQKERSLKKERWAKSKQAAKNYEDLLHQLKQQRGHAH